MVLLGLATIIYFFIGFRVLLIEQRSDWRSEGMFNWKNWVVAFFWPAFLLFIGVFQLLSYIDELK